MSANNHAEKETVKSTYQRHSHAKEMKRAWHLLGAPFEVNTGPQGNHFAQELDKDESRAQKRNRFSKTNQF